MNRRVRTSTLKLLPFAGTSAYRAEWHRYREGKRIYSIPFGIVWVSK